MAAEAENHNEHHATTSRGRMLVGHAVLLQDWGQESEHAFQYWELFLDLLLVAAASSVTDQFKEHLSLQYGLGEFVVFYSVLLNGWLLYSHHITSRYHDNSLAHSMVLFFYIVGFGLAMVNVGYKSIQAFCWGAILQRASVLVMIFQISLCLPRSRYTNSVLAFVSGLTMVLLLVIAVGCQDIMESPLMMILFWIAAGLEFFGEVFMTFLLRGNRLVPINIEHTTERLGAMELVFLGETVLSVTVIYREMLGEREMEEKEEELANSPDGANPQHAFYWVLIFSFLLVFMFLLLYFHMQPSPCDHALRRSRIHGASIMLLHKVLGLAILAVSVSVKIAVHCLLVVPAKEMPTEAAELMGYGAGAFIFILFGMRYLHYGGRDSINFDTLVLHHGVDPQLDRIANMWWWTIGLAGFLPLVGVMTGFTTKYIQDPLVLTGAHAGLMLALVIIESYFTDVIQDKLIRQEDSTTSNGEHEALASNQADYGT